MEIHSPPTQANLAAATRTHTQHNFTITTRKLPISKARAIDSLTDRIGIPMPEMIFGDNLVRVEHHPTQWAVEFSAADALDAVDRTGERMLKVAYARDWESSREQTARDIREVVRPFDWSYSTEYRGTVLLPSTDTTTTTSTTSTTSSTSASIPDGKPDNVKSSTLQKFTPTQQQIPIHLLKRRDPILFFDEVVLYESELDDNGVSVYSAKLRVHERRMLLLCRLFMRLDNVVVRVRDTRLYVDFETDLVLREYVAKEAPFEDVRTALLRSGRLPDDVNIALRDPNLLDPLLAVTEHQMEQVDLRG